MELLFVSSLCSKNIFETIFLHSKVKPLQSIQKFHSLLVSGMAMNGAHISSISELPAQNIDKRYFSPADEKQEFSVFFQYIPFVRVPVIKAITNILFVCLYFFRWWNATRKFKNDRFIVCDIFSFWSSITVLFLSKIFNVKTCLILTDLPSMISSISKKNRFTLGTVTTKLGDMCIRLFDSYIFITEQMNSVVNRKMKPYIVMEGLVDDPVKDISPSFREDEEFHVMYSGGLFEKYGIKKLIDSFKYIPCCDIKLFLYGNGELVDVLNGIHLIDNRISYMGVLLNSEIVVKQRDADLLINPRSSKEEFTKYSFPIKNLEYMTSGVPLLTSRLPGIPEEYFTFVYTIDEETEQGIADAILSLYERKAEIMKMGERAQLFVSGHKNYRVQGKRVVDFLYSLRVV